MFFFLYFSTENFYSQMMFIAGGSTHTINIISKKSRFYVEKFSYIFIIFAQANRHTNVEKFFCDVRRIIGSAQ